MDAYDADIVIYASKGDARGARLVSALSTSSDAPIGIGSTLLAAETLVPGVDDSNRARVESILDRLALVPLDLHIARTAGVLRGIYRLKTPDATHLATAIMAGAERFVTGNRRDFRHVREIEMVFT